MTSRGLKEADMEEIASCIDLVLKAIGTPAEAQAIADAGTRAHALMTKFPLPYKSV
jgi:glycine hydroxymethyltransferase